jgi:hypothetical protein
MKLSILIRSLSLVAAIVLASSLSTQASAQNPATGSGEASHPNTASSVPKADDAPTADQPTPQTQEEQRYSAFFRQLRAWDENADHSGPSGILDSSEFSRTRLEKDAGLTSSEAADVNRIVFQYMQDDQDQEKMIAAIRNRAIADYPNSWKSVVDSDPECANLRKLQSTLLSRAIEQLSSTLGPKRFTKLDSYTRHFEDKTKAAQSRKQPAPAQPDARM